jgi:hypothetical protein
LLSDFSGRNLQLEEFKDPKPGFIRNPELVDPSVRKVVKGITTTLAAILLALDPVGFIAATVCAKNMAILPAESTEV